MTDLPAALRTAADFVADQPDDVQRILDVNASVYGIVVQAGGASDSAQVGAVDSLLHKLGGTARIVHQSPVAIHYGARGVDGLTIDDIPISVVTVLAAHAAPAAVTA